MLLNKWDYITKTYEPFDSPAVKPALYVEDMEQVVDCANCGKELKFGDTFTSKTIHTHIGFGYGVCESCYEQELLSERKEQ